tara:strand:- start:2998 stop:3156 length:159 start_codon:yes stop_codon:yes gene_type:complete
MTKRLSVYPPNGGLPVEISEDQIGLYESRGWTQTLPKTEPIKASENAKGGKK